MSDKRETRDVEIENVEIREGGATMIAGHAAVFDKLSEDLGGFREKIAPGAFQRSIDKAPKRDIYALWQHQSDKPLGRAGNGTLRLIEDKRGLAVEIDPPATSWGADALASVKRGDTKHFSFGFEVLKDQWDFTDPKNVIRTLQDVRLIEVSPVTFPAYPQTSAEARATVAEINKRNGESVDALSRAKDSAQARASLEARVRVAEIELS